MLARTFFRPWTLGRCLGSCSILLLGLGGLGCEDETEELPGIPLQQFTEEFRGATCEHVAACNFMPDVQTCMAVIGQEKGIVQSVASANGGTLAYDPAAARACVEALRSAPCTGDRLIPRSIRETCDSVFAGRKGDGEPCYHAAECEGLNAVCEGACDDSCCEGVCRLEAGFAKLGESCAMKGCTEDTYCSADPDPTMPVCVAKIGPGESCAGAADACTLGYSCDPGTQTCFKQADPGGACNPDLAADGCFAIGEYCDADQRKCLPLPGVGEPCRSNAYGNNFCAFGYAYCNGGTMTCAALPKEGEACPGDICLGMQLGSGIADGLRCSDPMGGACIKAEAVAACVAP